MRENSRRLSMKPNASSTLFGGPVSSIAAAFARRSASISDARVGSPS
jgi:hypothetical protein